ncbi:GAF and ANTAR domain-containing protein [Solihabitans fulvus]|uniref:GAF and ANTAR domain-containing protein n=1 Tax=Solihabitans fulvus TaxID=1892852 RepID=A0A5B2XM70_9PSEU|nr:GAF and ANTAR domain-containing protein [Solihabitans fulvus]
MAETFVELADTLVDDFDLIDFLHLLAARSVELLKVDAAGLLLVDHQGQLRVIAASTEQARMVELFELQNDEGPCLECYRTGAAVTVPDLSAAAPRWPRFALAAREAGFAAVHALPMRLRDEVIGALNLFHTKPGALDRSAADVGQAMADVATIGLLQERSVRRQETLAEQLQGALNSRVLIEQAKGVLAERLRVDMAQAFNALRGYARHHNALLLTIAGTVVSGPLSEEAIDQLRAFARRSA